MAGRLEGKRAVVTAAGQGIGRASALLFHRQGAEVWALDINSAALESLPGESRGIGTAVVDVTDPTAVAAIAKDAGPIDILFNCAGYVHHGAILDCDESAFDFSMSTECEGDVPHGARVFARHAAARPRQHHQHVVGRFEREGAPNRFIYGTTKAAVIGLTRSIAADYVGQGIRCNCICRARPKRRRSRDASTRSTTRWKPARCSSRANRWAASAPPRRLPPWPSTSPPTSPRTRPAPPRSSTAGGRTDAATLRGDVRKSQPARGARVVPRCQVWDLHPLDDVVHPCLCAAVWLAARPRSRPSRRHDEVHPVCRVVLEHEQVPR